MFDIIIFGNGLFIFEKLGLSFCFTTRTLQNLSGLINNAEIN